MPGPVPKRSDQRRRRNASNAVDRGSAGRPLTEEDWKVDPEWHQIAKDWFNALRESGQSAFYEASDVAQARYIAEAMSRNLAGSRFSAQLFAAVDSASTRLMVTEGDRRRLRVELERATDADDSEAEAKVARMAEYRRRVAD